MTFLYLFLNIASFFVPFLYSFEKKMNFIALWKAVFFAISIVAIPFIIWDIIFTSKGVWGFNATYHIDFNLLGLPIEEILFFVCIPYASIFTHYALIHFFGKVSLPPKVVRLISTVLLLVIGGCLVFAYPKMYTTVNFSFFIILILYSLLAKDEILNRFYLTFLIILIPFFIVNGLLTGSFIEDEVVWYNNAENLGIRLGTIPVEDIIYAFNLLYPSLILIEKFKPILSLKK